MYEEIDLRLYIRALLRNWMWIVGAAVLASVVAFGVSSLLPPTYEARATVVVVGERETIQFDPRFSTLEDVPGQPLSAYPELATSDEMLQQLLAEVGDELPEVETVQGLRGMLEATAGRDPSLVFLSVSHGDPETAARVANVWGELFVSWAGDVYRSANGEQLAFFQEQLEQVEAELEAAEDALVEFEARNRSSILDNQLLALRETQTSYLDQERSIRFLLEDVRDLREQLAEEPGDGAVSFADQLAALSLQLQAFNAEAQPSLQFQADAEVDLTGKSRQEQVRYLDSLAASLETRMEEIEGSLEELEPRMLALQAEKQAVDTEGARLERERSVVAETHEALSRKVAEERIVAESVEQTVRLASRAAVPVRPAGTGLLTTMVLSGIVGLLVGVGIVLALRWWHGEPAISTGLAEGQGQTTPEQQAPARGVAGQSGPAVLERAESRS